MDSPVCTDAKVSSRSKKSLQQILNSSGTGYENNIISSGVDSERSFDIEIYLVHTGFFAQRVMHGPVPHEVP
jgi:hypothetical protein